MANKSIEDLGTQELEKRSRFARVLLWVLAAVAALNIAVGAATKKPSLFVVAAALVAIGLPMYVGRKRVAAELRKRAGV